LEAAQLDNSEPVAIGRVKKPKLNAVGIGKISGRAWKAPEPKRASAIRNPKVSSSWDTKMKVKAEKQAYLTMKREAKEARSEKLRNAREQREAAMKRKEENRSKSAVVQKLSSSTAKKMMKSKKARKHLATV
jgi:rRNA-processing protein CGR1